MRILRWLLCLIWHPWEYEKDDYYVSGYNAGKRICQRCGRKEFADFTDYFARGYWTWRKEDA